MNITELLVRQRQILGELPQTTNQPTLWSDAELLNHLNSGLEALWHRASLSDENWGVDFLTLTELSAQQLPLNGLLVGVLLPEDVGQIIYLEEGIGANDSGFEIPPTTLRDMWRSKSSAWPYFSSGRAWIHGANQGGLIFTKTDVPLNLSTTRVWFKRRAPRMVRFTASGFAASTLRVNLLTGATLGTFSTSKDYYKNTFIQCTTGNPANTSPQGLKVHVSGDSITAYPSIDISTVFPHGAPVGATVWETLPLFPESQHELLAQLGAFRALAKGADQAQRVIIGQDVATLFDDFVQMAEARQVQYPRTVNYEE